MKISYNWLQEYIETSLDIKKITDTLTDVGLEVENIDYYESVRGGLRGIIVGEIVQCEKHPDADKLKITQVNLGYGIPLQIVCGAPNVEVGQKVAVATIGSVLYPKNGREFQINQTKIRGEISNGMICSEHELGVGDTKDGILVLNKDIMPGTPLNDIIKITNDYCIEIGLTPNRTDAMSHYGVARDLHAALKSRKIDSVLKDVVYDFSLDKKSGNPIIVTIEDLEDCPRYSGIYIKNVEIKPSPEWLQNRLKIIGLTPVNNIVDITNYILHAYGQPLHAFDADKIKNSTIKVGYVSEGVKLVTLDGIERKLSQEDLVIKDGEDNPMCIAGILGGKDYGITNETKNIFLESAYFNRSTIRKTSKRLGINTDASFRFERGTDPNFIIQSLKLAVNLIRGLGKGTVLGEIIDHYPTKIDESLVTIRYHKVDQILGKRIHRDKIKEILKTLEIEIISDNEALDIRIPTYRVDVIREIDVIEEIARIYGYNNIDIPEKIKYTFTHKKGKIDLQLENSIANQLKYNGFNEVMNNSLTQKRGEDTDTDYVEVLNPLSSELNVMRKSLLYGIINNIAFNIKRQQKKIKLFEFGKVYFKIREKYIETTKLALALWGDYQNPNWIAKDTQSTFFHLKGIIKQIMQSFSLYDIDEIPLLSLEFETGVELRVKQHVIAKLGTVKKDILKKQDIKGEVYYAEIDWGLLIKTFYNPAVNNIIEVSKFPAVRRDLALLLDKKIQYIDLYKAAFQIENNLLKGINLFDVYEGDNLPENKKSYAMSFYLQNDIRTLIDEEIEEVMEQIITKYKNSFNVELRS